MAARVLEKAPPPAGARGPRYTRLGRYSVIIHDVTVPGPTQHSSRPERVGAGCPRRAALQNPLVNTGSQTCIRLRKDSASPCAVPRLGRAAVAAVPCPRCHVDAVSRRDPATLLRPLPLPGMPAGWSPRDASISIASHCGGPPRVAAFVVRAPTAPTRCR